MLMCGRYSSFLPPEAVARLFHKVNPMSNIPETWNMARTQNAMIVRHHPETGERHLDLLKWGLLPYFPNDPARTSDD
jgi:putative SOS response-associated peptidase YedK